MRSCRYLVGVMVSLLAGVTLLGVGTGFAQTKQYLTATEYQWVYDALQHFAAQGYIANYPKEWVQSGHDLSRIEVAYYIKQLLENGAAAHENHQAAFSPQTIELVQKMMSTFTDELTALGINTTDIEKISPRLMLPTPKPSDYLDLDLILDPVTEANQASEPSILPCYYFGQYYAELQRKEFVFLPAEYVAPGDYKLLESGINDINVVYQLGLKAKQLFLIMKGDLPVKDQTPVAGYYLFPLGDQGLSASSSSVPLENSILALVDEVKQLKQVDNIQRMEGRVSLNGYFKLETGVSQNMFRGNIDRGIKIGSMLVYSDDPVVKPKPGANHQFGLPSYNSRQSAAVDWDILKQDSLDSLQINIKGSVNLSPLTAVYGRIDLLYQESDDQSLFEGILPPEAKYSAGVNYQMSNYWRFLSYQSFVSSNSSSKSDSEWLSTTSFGVEYKDWLTLWLAYQMLDFKSERLTGVITFRF